MVLADEASHSEGILLIAPLENKRSWAFALAQGLFGIVLPQQAKPTVLLSHRPSVTSKG
jgi:hypothetical protein